MKLSEVAKALDGELIGDGDLEVARLVDPARANGGNELAVAIERPAFRALQESKARAAVVAKGARVPEGLLEAYVLTPRPRVALAELTALFEPALERPRGVHPQAAVDPSAELGEGVSVGAFAVVGPNARIGDRTTICEQVNIAEGAVIGADGMVQPGARVCHHVVIGNRVLIHPNAVIGGDGFSYTTPKLSSVESAKRSGRVESTNDEIVRVHSLGTVRIGDDVEIGSLTSIDRGTLRDTVIKDGAKIDNQVQVGHNVEIGENCMICAQVGLAGSAVIGDRVVLAGKVGVADHVKIGADSVVGAGSGLNTDVPEKSMMYGFPALPVTEAVKHMKQVRTLGGLYDDVEAVKAAVERLESAKKAEKKR